MSEKQPEALRLADTLYREWKDDSLNYDTALEAAAELRRLYHQTEVLRAERDHGRACLDSAVKLLTGIYALLYPVPTTLPYGRVMVFRPKSLDQHEVLQELSDRIRALPDELEKVAAIQQAEASTADSESVASDIYLGACITGGQLHATAMRKDSRGFVYVLATAEMNVEQLRNRDCIAKMGVTHPAPGVPDDVVREALAWGKTYGPEIPAHQWDEMRESMVAQLSSRLTAA